MSAPAETEKAKPLVVVIDGEIGAGKTTLIDLLVKEYSARKLKAVVVPEPVDQWKRVGILQEFYANKKESLRSHIAYEFQTYTFVTRVKSTMGVVEAHPDADVYILERSILTDRFVFMELQREMVGPMLMAMYDEWWSVWSKVSPLQPDKIVYLKPTLSNCQTRVGARAREGEVAEKSADEVDKDASARGGVSAAYQARLRLAHEAYLQGHHQDKFPGMPARPFDIEKDVVVVDGKLADDDFSKPGPAAARIASFIVETLPGCASSC